jgi:hypothetical protein
MERNVPLSGGFMMIAIVGFFVSLFMVYNKVSHTWGVAMMLVFIIMFLASVVSMSNIELNTLLKLERAERGENINEDKTAKAAKKAKPKKAKKRR